MDAERWARVRGIFEEVEDLPADEARDAARVRAAGDERVVAEVLALLDADDSEDELLDPWVRALDESRGDEDEDEGEGEGEEDGEGAGEGAGGGRRIGDFTLRRVLGSGGMGTVYEAEQDEPRRIIALKTLRDGLVSAEARERFHWESRLLARLEHTAIARVYAVGTFRREGGADTPYFAMEYIEGARTIRQWALEELPPRAEVLGLFADLCGAVQHGHDRGVLHRDLKPGNILVDRDGRPKVIDFGVARALDPEVTAPHTSAGELVGTLAYMSPEQVSGPSGDVDVRTDVYSLGVVLYELLCGTKPVGIDGLSLGEAVVAIRDEPPRRPSASDPTLKGDLEWICLRALEKEPERRYPSPAALADDLRRHLDDLPVQAGPPGLGYRLSKFVRRNRVAVLLGAAVVLALAAGFAVSVRQFLRAESEVVVRNQVSRFLTDMLTRVRPEESHGPELTVRELLDWASAELEGRFDRRPIVEVELRSTIGESYVTLGRYDAALEQFTRAERLAAESAGHHSGPHVLTLSSLGRLEAQRGDYAAAVRSFEEVLPLVWQNNGEDDEFFNTCRANYAIALFDIGRAEEALGIASEVVEWRRTRFGPSDPRFLRVALTLASQLALAGHIDEAEACYEEVSRGVADSPSAKAVLTNYANEYGGFLLLQERHAEAVEVLEDGLRTVTAMYGEDHLYGLVVRANLANALIHADEVVAGMGHYDVLFAPDREMPVKRLETTTHRLIYAEGLRRMKRPDEARLQLDLWEKEARAELPADHPAFGVAEMIRSNLDPARK